MQLFCHMFSSLNRSSVQDSLIDFSGTSSLCSRSGCSFDNTVELELLDKEGFVFDALLVIKMSYMLYLYNYGDIKYASAHGCSFSEGRLTLSAPNEPEQYWTGSRSNPIIWVQSSLSVCIIKTVSAVISAVTLTPLSSCLPWWNLVFRPCCGYQLWAVFWISLIPVI